MDEQARATYVLAAATLAAVLVQNHPNYGPQSAVEKLSEVLTEMERQGFMPVGIALAESDENEPGYEGPMPIVVE